MMVKDKKQTLVSLDVPTGGGMSCTLSATFGFPPRNSFIFCPDTARLLCALSMSSSDNSALTDNLDRLGFGDIIISDNISQSPDRAGVCIASRAYDNCLYTIIVIKGTEGREWHSNFDIGFSAEHRGFSRAADFAELLTGDYIFTRAIGMEPRFIITGVSRGGAVANILAKRLCERYGTDSVWAYTFASPNVTISRRRADCRCIFNLVRDEDVFTRIPLEGWGYSRYGRDIRLKTGDGFNLSFKALTGSDYIGFDKASVLDGFLCAVMKLAPNVHAYYKRRREVGDRRLSMYEFMTSVADALSSEQDAADILMSAMMSDYADLLSFISEGADIGELIAPSAAVPKCSITDSHSPAAYIAAMECGFS